MEFDHSAPATNPQDNDHLRILSVVYYVFAGLTALLACIPFIHVGIGILMLTSPEMFQQGQNPPPQEIPGFVGWIFVIVGSLVIIFGWVFAYLYYLTGHSLSNRRNYTFCIVIAAITCLSVPIGTILGVLTILVLNRESVKMQFESTGS